MEEGADEEDGHRCGRFTISHLHNWNVEVPVTQTYRSYIRSVRV